MRDDSPIRAVAVPEFIKEFSDILNGTAKITEFEASLIEGTYEILFFCQYTQGKNVSLNNTARIAYKAIEKGAVKGFKSVAEAFFQNIDDVSILLNDCFQKRRQAEKELDIDQRIEKYLCFYNTMYESLIPVLLAPLAISVGLTHPKKKKFKLDRDGRAKLTFLGNLEFSNNLPRKQLSIGLNNHLRNSYAHSRYEILDNGFIKLWDVNPGTGELSWGPEVWGIDQLINISEDLWKNALGYVYALILFSTNHRRILVQGGYCEKTKIRTRSIRKDFIKKLCEKYAGELGFNSMNISFESKLLKMELRTKLKGIDQNAEIIMGNGKQFVKKYIVKQKYIDSLVIEQVIALIQKVYFQLTIPFDFWVIVNNHNNELIGEVKAGTNLFDQLLGTRLPNILEFRRKLEADTLGEQLMPVLIKSLPVETSVKKSDELPDYIWEKLKETKNN